RAAPAATRTASIRTHAARVIVPLQVGLPGLSAGLGLAVSILTQRAAIRAACGNPSRGTATSWPRGTGRGIAPVRRAARAANDVRAGRSPAPPGGTPNPAHRAPPTTRAGERGEHGPQPREHPEPRDRARRPRC